MNLHARLRVVLACELVGHLRRLVFAVVISYDEGKFARIVLSKQRAGRFADGGCFIAGWNDGDYAGPPGRRGVFDRGVLDRIVVERLQTPEHAPAKSKVEPDAE